MITEMEGAQEKEQPACGEAGRGTAPPRSQLARPIPELSLIQFALHGWGELSHCKILATSSSLCKDLPAWQP